MKRLFFIIMCAISCLKACDLKAVMPPLKDGELLRIEFTQIKKITGLPKDLVSSGAVFLTKSKGLLWKTEKPFSQVMFIDKSGIYNLVKGAKLLITENKQTSKVSDILSKVLSGDFDALDMFDVSNEMHHGKVWKKVLTPKTDGFKILKTITVEGSTNINKVTIQRISGDVETIVFSGHKTLGLNLKYKYLLKPEQLLFE